MLVHRRPLIHRNDAFWRGWAIAQCAVGPDSVVVNAPLLDEDLSLAQAVEQLAVEQLAPEPGVEAFAISVLPRRAWLDVSGLGPDRCDPVPHLLSNTLWAVIGSYVSRRAAQDEQVGQRIQHIG